MTTLLTILFVLAIAALAAAFVVYWSKNGSVVHEGD